MNKFVKDVLLQRLVVILDTVSLPLLQGVTAMRQHHRHNLMLIVQQMAAMDMINRNLVLDPFTIKVE